MLDIKNLSIYFRSEAHTTTAVQKVSFSLSSGETLGIVGESGSGKSVSCLAVMGLLPPPPACKIEGEIWFESNTLGRVNLLDLPEDQFRFLRGKDIAMIFQEPMTSLNPVFTCGYQVMENILIHEPKTSPAEAKARTIELFDRVQIDRPEARFNQYPHELSGGQKQRVMIAMALACNPQLLIADEPTTALDVTVQREILELLEELRRDIGISILFITHDLGVIAEIADRVMVMWRGQVMEEGEIMRIFDTPKHPYTKGLLACRPRLNMQMNVLPTVNDFLTVSDTGEIIEKPKSEQPYSSVGEALLMNFVPEEDLVEYHEKLYQQTPLLTIKNLKTYFPQRSGWLRRITDYKKAVDDVSFEVYPGETVGLVGESGCGKTTLGRTILRLVEATSGEVNFEGENILEYPHHRLRELRRNMQMIFQDPYSSLNPRLTVGETIIEPMRLHRIEANDKIRRDKVMDLLETVGLPTAYYHRYPHEFSGGQRQRIAIARALCLQPKFIIADECVSALDVSVQAQVLNLLNELKEKFNLTYIFISHDLSVVKFISDRIVVMNKGKIEEIDFTEEIYEKQKTDYTRKLINAIPKGTMDDVQIAKKRREDAAKKDIQASSGG